MKLEISSIPFCVSLVGFRGAIKGKCIAEVGKQLMDRMWEEVRGRGIKSTGINHWVYLPDSQMFTGIVLAGEADDLGSLEKLELSLERYLRYVHKGAYSELPAIWPQLLDRLKGQGETPAYPNLEIYGHWNSNPAECETTILIGLHRNL